RHYGHDGDHPHCRYQQITLKPSSIEIKGDEIKVLGKNTFVEGDRVDINIEKS
ncbi:Rhs family protein, partial [Pseudomonas syringae pv. pisi str. 1704B]